MVKPKNRLIKSSKQITSSKVAWACFKTCQNQVASHAETKAAVEMVI